MFERIEKVIKFIYLRRKIRLGLALKIHPDEEKLACFAEDKLSDSEKKLVEKHILVCELCSDYLFTQLKIKPHLSLELPVTLQEKVKELLNAESKENPFEILLRLKEKIWEIINTTGDVLVGQELVPAPVLRSRQINEFKEEINIFKDIKELRVLAKIQSKNARKFNLTITITEKTSRKAPKNLRIALFKGDTELESYSTDSGLSSFENIDPGSYWVQINRNDQRIALIDLKVNI